MSSLVPKSVNTLRAASTSSVFALKGGLKAYFSTRSLGSDDESDNKHRTGGGLEFDDSDILPQKTQMQLQGVDPRKGWNFRGVHRAIICGKIGQAPEEKIFASGTTLVKFTVGTGGMYDQRIVGANDLPKPAQWHQITVLNKVLGTYAVQHFVKNSSVYVEGDIETRVYSDRISGELKTIPEICVRQDGKLRLLQPGETTSNISLDELREALL